MCPVSELRPRVPSESGVSGVSAALRGGFPVDQSTRGTKEPPRTGMKGKKVTRKQSSSRTRDSDSRRKK